MNAPQTGVVIPDRPSFKAAEVCELLKVQPYVLRSWENEFKDLGVAKTPGGPRVYRRSDVELAMRIRHLVFAEGLTLAGARRRLERERAPAEPDEPAEVPAPAAEARSAADPQMRERLERAKAGLRGVLQLLGSNGESRPERGTVRSTPSAPRRSTPSAEPGGLFELEPRAPHAAPVPDNAVSPRQSARKKKADGIA